MAQGVSIPWFDLDDVGAEVCKMLSQQIAGDEAREVNDPKTAQGTTRAGRVVSAREARF
jgi:hypothetical protein